MIRQPHQITLSTLTRDPVLAEIFRRAERDGLASAAGERPRSPRHDGAAVRVLELA